MSSKRITPERMCVACREMKDKRGLLRVVRSPEGVVAIDASGKAPGRGAYLCANEACLKRAQKAHNLEKALKTQIDETVFTALAEEIARREYSTVCTNAGGNDAG